MIVVDSNVIAYCWIHGERTTLAHRLRRLDPDWHAPVLWRSELRNILAGYRRDGSLDASQVRGIMAAAEAGLAGREHPGARGLPPAVNECGAVSGVGRQNDRQGGGQPQGEKGPLPRPGRPKRQEGLFDETGEKDGEDQDDVEQKPDHGLIFPRRRPEAKVFGRMADRCS